MIIKQVLSKLKYLTESFGVYQFQCLNKIRYNPDEIDISKVLETKKGGAFNHWFNL